jgi:hypothetical protein
MAGVTENYSKFEVSVVVRFLEAGARQQDLSQVSEYLWPEGF